MPRLSMQVPHSLGREEAERRLTENLGKFRDQVTDLQEQWQDHTLTFHFKAMGFPVGGTLAVEGALVKIDVDLPLAAMMIKGMIEQRLGQEARAILA